jgi:hypothetical protein
MDSNLCARRMTRGSTGGPSWYPTIPNRPSGLLGHLEGSARPAPTAPGALGTCPGRRLCLVLIPICEYSLGTLKFSAVIIFTEDFFMRDEISSLSNLDRRAKSNMKACIGCGCSINRGLRCGPCRDIADERRRQSAYAAKKKAVRPAADK